MWHRQFESMGTIWKVTVDGDEVSKSVEQEIYTQTDDFDQQFSRFIETSEANKFRNKTAGTYTVSAVFTELLQFAQQLKQETKGKFDPAIGSLLEAAGYDAQYCFRPDQEKVEQWQTPKWNIERDQLTIENSVVFDIGGYGKGYWIDQISTLLLQAGYKHFLVDGGGDMFGTSKQDDKPWNIAVEKPGDPETAISVVPLYHQAIAISDIFRRSWDEWHHTLDPQQKQPAVKLAGCAVVAPTAMVADGLTTCIALSGNATIQQLTQEYDAAFLAVTTDTKMQVSQNWPGHIFS